MRRLLARLAGLLIPRPPPRNDLTPRRRFRQEEEALKRLDDELAYYRIRGRR